MILLVNGEALGHERLKVESKREITLCNAYRNQYTSDNLQPWKCLSIKNTHQCLTFYLQGMVKNRLQHTAFSINLWI